MYISLADSRAKGFKKWADIHQLEKLGGARAGASEGGVIAAPDLAQGVTPFFKAFGTAICQGNIHLHTFSNSGQTRYGIYFRFYPVFCRWAKYFGKFPRHK